MSGIGGGAVINIVGATVLTTKGDLITFDGTNIIRLAVGADGQVLKANSGETSGLEWATDATGGGSDSLARYMILGS